MTDEQPEQPTNPPGFETPNHEDYDRMVRILTQGLDVQSVADPDFDLSEYVAEYVDVKSISYLGLQRVVRAFGIDNPIALAEQMDAVMRMVSLYLEGFTLGSDFERIRMAEEQALDAEMMEEAVAVPDAPDVPEGEGEPGEAASARCPQHGIPDCSPLLNGCSYFVGSGQA